MHRESLVALSETLKFNFSADRSQGPHDAWGRKEATNQIH